MNKEYENAFIECPVCGAERARKGIMKHIKNQAKNEIYEWYLVRESIPCPHQIYLEKIKQSSQENK